MTVAIVVVLALGYGCGLACVRRAGRRFPPQAAFAFAAGLGVFLAALSPSLDTRADASLAWHMLQHLLLMGVVAPLLLLGAPLRLILAALPSGAATRLAAIADSQPARVITSPAFAWLQFAAVLYGVHFSGFYGAALDNAAVHVLEHMVFLTSALVFWAPILAVAPMPHAPSHPLRLLMIFLALPMSAFLGFAFYVARHPLYAHYASSSSALADQANAGAVMWLGGGAPLLLALLWCVADWGARERRLGAALDVAS